MNAVSRGIRLLLARPLLRADDDGFDLVIEQHEPIAAWFEQHCGWQLHVERDYALLRKNSRPDATRPACTASGAPFDRRRYALLCLMFAELEAVPVTTAGLLRERLGGGEAFDDVLEFVERLGVLRPFEGKYRVDRTLIERLVTPSTTDTLFHRLIDDPVVYKEDLTPEQRVELRHEAVEEAGFILEERKEGFLLVDPEGVATDMKFPDDGNAETVALTLLNLLPATRDELEAQTRDLITRYRVYRPLDAEQLTRQAIDVLVAFGLAAQDGDTTRPLPAAARYRP